MLTLETLLAALAKAAEDVRTDPLAEEQTAGIFQVVNALVELNTLGSDEIDAVIAACDEITRKLTNDPACDFETWCSMRPIR